MNEDIVKNCNEAQAKYLTEYLKNNLSKEFEKEWFNYNKFLDEVNISVLPDNMYKDGKKLDYGEVRKMYSEWEISAKKK